MKKGNKDFGFEKQIKKFIKKHKGLNSLIKLLDSYHIQHLQKHGRKA